MQAPGGFMLQTNEESLSKNEANYRDPEEDRSLILSLENHMKRWIPTGFQIC